MCESKKCALIWSCSFIKDQEIYFVKVVPLNKRWGLILKYIPIYILLCSPAILVQVHCFLKFICILKPLYSWHTFVLSNWNKDMSKMLSAAYLTKVSSSIFFLLTVMCLTLVLFLLPTCEAAKSMFGRWFVMIKRKCEHHLLSIRNSTSQLTSKKGGSKLLGRAYIKFVCRCSKACMSTRTWIGGFGKRVIHMLAWIHVSTCGRMRACGCSRVSSCRNHVFHVTKCARKKAGRRAVCELLN